MLSLSLIIFPFIITILFAFIFALRHNKSTTDKILLALSVCSAIYFFAEANYITPLKEYKAFAIADILSQFARPLIPPLMVLCLRTMLKRLVWKWWMSLVFTVAIIIGSVSMCIYLIMGLDNAATYISTRDGSSATAYEERIYILYEVFCVWLYRATNIFYASVGIARIIYLFYKTKFRFSEIPNFLFRAAEIEPVYLMGILYLAILATIYSKFCISQEFLLTHQSVAAIFCFLRAALVILVGYIGIYNKEASVSLKTLSRFIDGTEPELEPEDQPNDQPSNPPIDQTTNPPIDQPTTNQTNIQTISNFSMLEEKKLFLDPHITVEVAAIRLNTNRTYLSKYIQQTYQCSFREYINILRINYSKDYMRNHPTAKQEVIAESCGFNDAPSFNKKFKQIVGKSPRLWLLIDC